MSTGSILRSQWREEEIRTHVRQLGKWFHNLSLGGVETAPDHFLGDYPAFKWRILEQCLPPDLRGPAPCSMPAAMRASIRSK
jgi:hypothetical protein